MGFPGGTLDRREIPLTVPGAEPSCAVGQSWADWPDNESRPDSTNFCFPFSFLSVSGYGVLSFFVVGIAPVPWLGLAGTVLSEPSDVYLVNPPNPE